MLDTTEEKNFMKPIRVTQLNAQQKKEAVIYILNKHINNFNIILLQEPVWGFIGNENGKDIQGPIALQGWIPVIPVTILLDACPRTMAYFRT